MGIIKAASHAVGTGLSDQWLEALEPDIWEHRLFLQKASSLEKEQVKMVKALITW